MTEWQSGEPATHGYYLATWIRGGTPTVSELWFNPAGGGGMNWWSTRGYIGERSNGMEGAIRNVIAWMPLPMPAEPSHLNNQDAEGS